MFFENNDLHKKMAGAQDLDGDGVISPQEAAAYIQQYIQNAPPEDRAKLMQEYFGQMPAEQKSALGTALVQSPATPVSSVRPGDDHDLIDAYTKAPRPRPRTARVRWRPPSDRVACSAARWSRPDWWGWRA